LERPLWFSRGQRPRQRHCNDLTHRYDAEFAPEGCAANL
jgi:hypothetical protein